MVRNKEATKGIVNTHLKSVKTQSNTKNNTLLNIDASWLFWLAVAIIAAFYILTLRPGHFWVGDDLQYIRHAINLIEGKPYIDPLYINNALASVAPSAYPPIFPLILFVIYALFGLNFAAMKVVLIGFFISALVVLKAIFKQRISAITTLCLILFLGLNPEFWDFKDRILSEFSFLFFSLTALYLMQRNNSNQTYSSAALLSLLMYLSYGIREIALILPLTLITYELWHYRKLTTHSMFAISIFTLLVLAQRYFFVFDPTHFEFNQQLDLLIEAGATPPTTFSYVNLDPESIIKQGQRYFWSVYRFLQLRHLPFSGYFYLFVNICVLTGYITVLIKKIRFTEIYVAGYMCALLLFAGFDGFRYLLPILPFYIFYLFVGILKLISFNHLLKKTAVTGLLLMFVYANSLGFSDKESTFLGPNTLSTKNEQLFSYVSDNTLPTDTFVARDPRILAFFTRRHASTYPTSKSNPEEFMKYLRVINTNYLIAVPRPHEPSYNKIFDLLLEKHPDELQLVFDNDTFRVYYLTNNK